MKFDNCLKAAIAYSQLGWKVFPCKPKSKKPATPHGVKDATTDEKTILEWWSKWPDANVALACGPDSGVYVVDVDYDEGKCENGWEDLEEFDALPKTIRQNTPRGGAHFIFKCEGTPPRNMNKFRRGIDIRCDGYYIMLAPSVHPDVPDVPYSWENSPWDTEAAEFPEFMKPPEKKKKDMPWGKQTIAPTFATAASDVRSRASAYLAAIEPAVQGYRGHDKLLWAARAMIEGFGLSQSEAVSILWAEYNPRCCPPWNPTDNADRRDFERKVQEVLKSPSGARIGHLMESTIGHQIDVSAAKRSAEALLASHDEKKTPDLIKRLMTKRAVADEPNPDDPGKTPEWMFNVPGLVSDVMEYTLETAPYANKALAFAGALALQSFLCSRKVRDEGDMRPNLYLLALAPSGSGKEWPRKMNKAILNAAGYGSGSIGDRFSSAEGVEDALARCPVKLYQTDEIDSLLQSLKSKEPLAANLMSGLLTMYGESSSIHYKRDKASDADSGFINNPHLVIYGTAIPTHFYSTLSDKMCTNGLLSRMIIIDAEAERKGKRAKIIDPPAKILDVAKFWKGFNPGGDMAIINPIPIVIPHSATANEIIAAFQAECDERWTGAARDNEVARAVFSRINEMSLKLAIVYACSENHKNPIIGEAAAKWATAFAMHQGKRMLAMLDRYGASSEFEKDCQKIIDWIKAAPNGSLAHSRATSRLKLSKKLFAERIDTLVDREKITVVDIPTGGRYQRTYELFRRKK